jgi:hypothetical protein
MVIMKKSFVRRCHAAFALWAILVIALMPGCVPKTVTVTVFFTDTIRYATGGPPFEVAVSREVNADANLPEAVLL